MLMVYLQIVHLTLDNAKKRQTESELGRRFNSSIWIARGCFAMRCEMAKPCFPQRIGTDRESIKG